MKKHSFFSKAMLLVCLGLLVPGAGAGEVKGGEVDKTLSPFFYVQSENAGVDALPLKSTQADVTISGVIADVQVTQVYKNEGKNTLEAIYIFPASTRAAVYAMRMTVGERVIEAKIQERAQARETYEKALAAGKTASLLEQQRPNVFQMNVGNILPGDKIKVVMNYTELLVPENGTYEFVYPTVVGPRYSNQSEATAPAQDKWVTNPYLHEKENAPFTFGFDLKLNSGLPIARLSSPSHDVNIEYTGKNTAKVTLKPGKQTNNRDVVIDYSLAGNNIESGLLLNQGNKENFFLLMLEPPQRVANVSIVPREYVFVVDVSGSMGGFPLDTAKALMQDLLKQLRPSDFFNVMLFSGGNAVLSETSLPATPANLRKALTMIDNEQGGGGTELMPALKRALALPRAESNLSRSMIIVTDGYVDVEKDAFEYIRQNLHKGNVFSFGIGSSVNRFLMEGLARAGMGEPFIVLNAEDAKEKAKKFREYIDSPVLTDVQVNFHGLKVSEVEPISIPDLFARKPVVVFGKYEGTPNGTVVITGKTAGGAYTQEIKIGGEVSTKNEALRYLWARHRIIRLADMVKLSADETAVKEVTQLGLQYNLLTDYTSFVAVDSQVRTSGRPQNTVKQPLPLPQGVGDAAVGGGSNQAMSCMSAPAPCSYRSVCKSRLTEVDEEREPEAQPQAKKEAQPRKAPKVAVNVQAIQLQVKKVEGGWDKASVIKTLEQQRSAIEKALAEEGLTGVFEVEIFVDAQGKVTGVNPLQDTFGSSKLAQRLIKVLTQMVFTVPPDRKPGKIRVEIQL
jgi:Ca-activated chloride channel family protein